MRLTYFRLKKAAADSSTCRVSCCQLLFRDGDGSITAEEFEEAFSKMSPVERANLGDVGELIAAADADGDGRIDFDEFMAMMN